MEIATQYEIHPFFAGVAANPNGTISIACNGRKIVRDYVVLRGQRTIWNRHGVDKNTVEKIDRDLRNLR